MLLTKEECYLTVQTYEHLSLSRKVAISWELSYMYIAQAKINVQFNLCIISFRVGYSLPLFGIDSYDMSCHTSNMYP